MGNNVPVELGINILPGRRVQDTTYRVQLKQYVAGKNNDHPYTSCEMLADLTKAYDHVRRTELVAIARRFNYPLHILAVCLTSYSWPRRLVAGKMATEIIKPVRGILAGAMAAPYEMALHTLCVLVQVWDHHKSKCVEFALYLCLHVHDLSITTFAQRGWSCCEALHALGKIALAGLQELGLVVAKGKTYYI